MLKKLMKSKGIVQKKNEDDDDEEEISVLKKVDAEDYLLDAPCSTSDALTKANQIKITPDRISRMLNQRGGYKMKSQEEIWSEKLAKMFTQKRSEMLEANIRRQSLCPANLFATLGDEYRLQQVIENGYDINHRDRFNGHSVIHDAVGSGHFHIVRMLCYQYEHQLDMNLQTTLGGSTALHLAIGNGFRQIVSLLLTFGAELNIQDYYGCVPLHYINNLHVLKLLLKYPQVDYTIRNRKGLTPYEYYAQETPPSEQLSEILEILKTNEEKQFLARAKILRAMKHPIHEKEEAKLAYIADGNSSTASGVTRRIELMKLSSGTATRR